MLGEDELENVKAGMNMTYDQAKAFHKFSETKHAQDELDELNEDELENIKAGLNVSYEEAKKLYAQSNEEIEESENTKSR